MVLTSSTSPTKSTRQKSFRIKLMIIAISIFFLKIPLRQNWYDIGLSSNTHMCKDSLQPGHKADLLISHYTEISIILHKI